MFRTGINGLALSFSKQLIASISHFNCCLWLESVQPQEVLGYWVHGTSKRRRMKAALGFGVEFVEGDGG